MAWWVISLDLAVHDDQFLSSSSPDHHNKQNMTSFFVVFVSIQLLGSFSTFQCVVGSDDFDDSSEGTLSLYLSIYLIYKHVQLPS